MKIKVNKNMPGYCFLSDRDIDPKVSLTCFRLRFRQVQHTRRSTDGHQQLAREPDHARKKPPFFI